MLRSLLFIVSGCNHAAVIIHSQEIHDHSVSEECHRHWLFEKVGDDFRWT